MSWRRQKKRYLVELVENKIKCVSKTLLATLFGMSRKSFYLTLSKQRTKDELLREQILQVLGMNPSYGHRRVAMALSVGKKRVRRVMKLYGIKPYKRKARWRKRRDLRQTESGYQNLIKGRCPIRSQVVYVGDFTYLRWNSKTIYLATYMDLYTREIVGWNVSSRHTKELVIEALLEAVAYHGKPNVIHTDQGSEYKSKEYTILANILGIEVSMSKKGSPWENGYQESFYNNFKTELGLEFERFQTVGELVEAIHQTINYYNKTRIHTALKMPPTVFRERKSVY